MEKRSSTRWITLGAAGIGVVLLLIASIFLLGRDNAPASSPLPTRPTNSPSNPTVAIVADEEIAYDAWREAVLVDHVMSHLGRIDPPAPRETLERLINESLILQATQPVPAPVEGEVEGYLTALKAGWGIDDVVLSAALAEAGLDRAALVRTVARLLEVERRQQTLETGGSSISAWLSQQRAEHDITIYEDRLIIDGLDELARSLEALAGLASSRTPTPPSLLSGLPTPVSPIPTPPLSSLPTPTRTAWPPVLPEEAPDFTLERAIGEQFTLSEQLDKGPVVLVFFQKCG